MRSHNDEDHRVILTRFLAEHVKEDVVVASTMDLLGWLRKHLEEPMAICCGSWSPPWCRR